MGNNYNRFFIVFKNRLFAPFIKKFGTFVTLRYLYRYKMYAVYNGVSVSEKQSAVFFGIIGIVSVICAKSIVCIVTVGAVIKCEVI